MAGLGSVANDKVRLTLLLRLQRLGIGVQLDPYVVAYYDRTADACTQDIRHCFCRPTAALACLAGSSSEFVRFRILLDGSAWTTVAANCSSDSGQTRKTSGFISQN
jgi:hypothetical protein